MSKWKSENSNWTMEIPNLPTFIFKLIIFCLCILLVKAAIYDQNLTMGILALIFVQFEIKFSDKIKQ